MTPKFYRLETLMFFLIIMFLLSMCSIWLLSHNYINEFATSRWVKVLSVLDAPETRLEHLGLIYPHFPVYILIPFYYLPGLNSGTAPYFASILVGAILLTIWNYHLSKKKYSLRMRALLVFLICIHPYFLWGITTGAQHALSLLMFYWLYIALVGLIGFQGVRAFIVIGSVLAIYFFIDERTFYLFLGLLPLLLIVAPTRMLKDSTLSIYLIIATPLAISVASWAYLNWIFSDDATLFLHASDSAFRGAWQDTPNLVWLRAFGGEFIKPTLYTALLSIMSYPVLFWLIYYAKRHRILLGSTMVLLIHPVVASGLATGNFFLAHPMYMIFLFSAGIMAGITLIPKKTRRTKITLLVLLAASSLSSWTTFSWWATDDMQKWKSAMSGQMQKELHAGDLKLGQWLKKHHHLTMLDDKSAYRVIASRGDAKNLLLPFSSEFKINMKYHWPTVEQLVVPDPRKGSGYNDALNLRFPNLYDNGITGYVLVYDADNWRVYRKKNTVQDI